jgi:hypothetical protein
MPVSVERQRERATEPDPGAESGRTVLGNLPSESIGGSVPGCRARTDLGLLDKTLPRVV